MTESGCKKRYNQYSAYLREYFNCKVYKITLSAGFSCPNRDGTISDRGCIFCDEGGSFSQAHSDILPIEQQLDASITRLKDRFNAQKFIAYFQAYSNTYAPVERLKNLYDRAVSHPDVVGLSIGTRPDCVDEEKLDLIASYVGTDLCVCPRYQYEQADSPPHTDRLVWLEYGLQSAHNRTLELINRGHTFEDFAKAVRMTQERGINTCAHVILGLPGETKEDMLETAKTLADLGIDGVKIHLFCVLKDTEVEKMYNRGELHIMSPEEYVETVCDFLELLPPSTIIHRIAGNGLSSIRIAPTWLGGKLHTLNMIDDELERRNSWQGKFLP